MTTQQTKRLEDFLPTHTPRRDWFAETTHKTDRPIFMPIGRLSLEAPAPRLTDRQRMELLIIPRLLWQVVIGGITMKDHPEAIRLKTLLKEAIVEPLKGMTAEEGGKIARRMERYHEKLCNEELGNNTNAKVALILWHMIRDLLDREVLVLYEGAALADALAMMLPMFEYVMDVEKIDASARKRAKKLLARFNRDGFFNA